VLVESVALPALSRVAVPKVVAPLVKVTFPVGIVDPEPCTTVAVKVTLWPNTEGLADVATVVVVDTVVVLAVSTTSFPVPPL